ncbi:MAG: isopentenyl-diphosphate Delta-isomerase [Bacteroidales bacterium]
MQNIPIYVVLVDETDHEHGMMEKMEAHRKGVLHRAVSVFIFNSKGEWLLQQRALNKYHCPGKWSNTSCTHPIQNETYEEAASRRLYEEMGIRTQLTQEFQFVYRAELDHDLIEHEYDTVFMGVSDELPVLNAEEVCSFRYLSTSELDREISASPDLFTPWFLKLYPRIKVLIDEKI